MRKLQFLMLGSWLIDNVFKAFFALGAEINELTIAKRGGDQLLMIIPKSRPFGGTQIEQILESRVFLVCN